MIKRAIFMVGVLIFLSGTTIAPLAVVHGENQILSVNSLPKKLNSIFKKTLMDNLNKTNTSSKYNFQYPDAVRGIYITGPTAGNKKLQALINLVNTTDLNSMVIDIKEDSGFLTYIPPVKSRYKEIGKAYIKDIDALMRTLEKNNIYPIARVVVFKDSYLANKVPKWSFSEGNKVWKNRRGESFVNPFIKDIWDYNIGIAIEAAKLGFQEIQFDYVRFPEGFERRDKTLLYSMGDYEKKELDLVQKRVQAVTDFVEYAKDELKPFGVKVSVDIFGYTATIPEAPGIGQNFSKISAHTDVISSMIYPSHWTSYFGIQKPDKEPYRLVKEYILLEKEKLSQLEKPPTSRPWLQDFTATWLGKGNYLVYGKSEVEAQIRALNDNGVSEFLLWNAANNYTKNVDYTP